jgi:hypothetical protein
VVILNLFPGIGLNLKSFYNKNSLRVENPCFIGLLKIPIYPFPLVYLYARLMLLEVYNAFSPGNKPASLLAVGFGICVREYRATSSGLLPLGNLPNFIASNGSTPLTKVL